MGTSYECLKYDPAETRDIVVEEIPKKLPPSPKKPNSQSLYLLINIISQIWTKNCYHFEIFEKTERIEKVVEYIETKLLEGEKSEYFFNLYHGNRNVDLLQTKYKTLGELLRDLEKDYVFEDSEKNKIVILVYRNDSKFDTSLFTNGLPSERTINNEKNRVIDEIVIKNELSVKNSLNDKSFLNKRLINNEINRIIDEIVIKNELSVKNSLNDESNLQSKTLSILTSTVPEKRHEIVKEICESLNKDMFNYDLPPRENSIVSDMNSTELKNTLKEIKTSDKF
jgi:hypothetical protein